MTQMKTERITIELNCDMTTIIEANHATGQVNIKTVMGTGADMNENDIVHEEIIDEQKLLERVVTE